MKHFPAPLRGILPAITTPFDRLGRVDFESLQTNLRKWNRYDLTGYVVLGSTGEYVMLNREEKTKVLETVRKESSSKKILIAGTGAQSTKETIELTAIAAATGYHAALIITPYYFKNVMTTETLKKHFFTVADHSPVPLLIYNMPSATGLDLTAEQILELSKHPNITGVKDSGNNIIKFTQVASGCKKGYTLLTGSASMMLPALAVGATGAILALANIAPRECIDLYNSFCKGNISKARILQHTLIPVNNAVTARWGIPGLKAAMDMLGWKGGYSRSPLQPLDSKTRVELKDILKKSGIRKSK